MSYKKDNGLRSFGDMSSQHILDKHQNHPLLLLSRTFSFEIFRETLDRLYNDKGRPGFDPVKMLRIILLGKLQNISDKRLCVVVSTDLLYREFCGFSIEEDTPDNSTISRFRDRIQPVWDNIWEDFCNYLEDNNYINEELVIADSTAIKSRGKFNTAKDKKDDDDKRDYSGQSDPDARHGHKSDKKPFFGYKGHAVTDGNTDFVVSFDLTPGNVDDGNMLPDLLRKVRYLPEYVTADKGYYYGSNHRYLLSKGIQDRIIPKGNPQEALKGIYRKRRRIERVFGVIKEKSGLYRTRFFGITKVGLDYAFAMLAYNLNNLLRFMPTY